ncbi:MAG: tetratricopeptide repeat protein [Deferribacterales bacterium]
MKQLNIKEAFQLAMQYHQKGNLEKAEYLYSAVLQLDPNNADALHYIGVIYAGKGMIEEAIDHIRRAVEYDKTNAIYHNNLGEIYRQRGLMEHAEFHLSAACELKPDYSDAFSNLGLVYKEKGLINDAKYCFAEALAKDPRNVNALINTGNLFVTEKNYEDAVQCYEAAIQLSPDNPNALASAASSYYEMGEYNSSAKYYSRLVNTHPDLHRDKVNLALITLRNKDFRKGLQLFEARFHTVDTLEGDRDTLWRGVNMKGKTLYVYNEKQGLSGYGDTIMFARYLTELDKYEPAKVVFRVQPELVDLLKGMMPEYVEVTSEDCTEFDAHCPLLSLLFVLNARAKTIPLVDGYIKADESKIASFASMMDTPKTKIGLVFQTSRSHVKHEERSIPQDAFTPLYGNDTIQLYYISKEEPDQPLHEGITDLRDSINDFSDTAAVIANLDVVITADTSVAHLAGAMGKKTVLLLNHLHDWRWFSAKTGKASEWYSSVIFHIKEKGSDWLDVVSSIKF